jgi:hypothetical protein
MIDRPALARIARLLLLATLIIVIDLRFEGFDVINDVVGAVLVIVGIVRLPGAIPQPVRYHNALLALAAVALAAAIAEQFDARGVVVVVLGWSNVVGAWLTARLFAAVFAAEGDDIFTAQWSASERLLLWLGIAPIIGLSILGWFLEPVEGELGVLAVVTILVAALPLFHLLVSLYRTGLLGSVRDGP